MTVQELITELKKYKPDIPVMFVDELPLRCVVVSNGRIYLADVHEVYE